MWLSNTERQLKFLRLVVPIALVVCSPDFAGESLAAPSDLNDTKRIERGLKFISERRVDQAVAEFDGCKNLSCLSDQQVLAVLSAYSEAEEESKILPLANMLIERQAKAKLLPSIQDRADALFYRAVCYRSLNKSEEAANDYKRGAEYSTDKAPNMFDYAGEQYRRVRKYDLALYCLNKAVNLSPGNPSARLHKGLVLDDLQKWNEALPCLSDAISICLQKRKSEPEGYSFVLCSAYKERAKCYSKLGQINKARADRNELGKLSSGWNDTVFGGRSGSAP